MLLILRLSSLEREKNENLEVCIHKTQIFQCVDNLSTNKDLSSNFSVLKILAFGETAQLSKFSRILMCRM
jgi:hypothetical protein